MKILSETSTQLDLQDNQYAAVIGGAILVAIGLSASGFLFVTRHDFVGLLPLLLSLGGVALIVTRRRVNISCNKDNQTITISEKGMIKSVQKSYQFSDVQKVQMQVEERQEAKTNSSNQSTMPEYKTVYYNHVMLLLNDGSSYQVTVGRRSDMSSITGFGKNYGEDIATKLAAFLGVPFDELSPLTAGGVVKAAFEAITGHGPAQTGVGGVVPAAPVAPVAAAPVSHATPVTVLAPPQVQPAPAVHPPAVQPEPVAPIAPAAQAPATEVTPQ